MATGETSTARSDALTVSSGAKKYRTSAAHRLDAWQAYLATAPSAVELPIDRPRQVVRGFSDGRCAVRVSDAAHASLDTLAEQENVSPEMAWLAVFAAFLHRYTQEHDLIIGTPGSGESVSEVKLWRTHVDGNQSVRELLHHVRTVAAEAADLGPISLSELGEIRRTGATGKNLPILHAGFVWHDNRDAEILESWWPSADLSLVCYQRGQTPGVELVYNTELFAAETSGRMAEHLAILLEHMVEDADCSISRLRLLSDAERRRITIEWNNTAVDIPRDRFLPHMIADAAERIPDATALAYRDERFTFSRLNMEANQIAHYLLGLGVGAGSRVGVCVERSTDSVVAQMGVIKAGGTVLFLDPTHPEARLALLIRSAETTAIVTREGLLDKLTDVQCPLICVDRDAEVIADSPTDNPEIHITSDTPVLVAATSGSTGDPKIVLCQHGALNNLTKWIHHELAVTTDDRATWLSSPGYGISQMEWWPFLAAGGSVYIGEGNVVGSPEHLRDWLVENAITHTLIMTPLAVRLWSLEWPKYVALRAMQVAGERLREWPPDHLPFEVLNVYGSAEATLVATCRLFTTARSLPVEERAMRLPPVGRPLINVRTYILDQYRNPVPPGVVGELYIAGEGLSLGYTKPELTHEKFVAIPLPEESTSVVYRTGDIARYWSNGTIDICGRVDTQVKIRGSRVELGEIENVLASQAGVQEVAVVDRENVSGDRQLVAYVVPNTDAPPSTSDLRAALQRTLPQYMVPAAYVFLDRLPLLRNGKVDRRALPAPHTTRPDLDVPYIAPRGAFEEKLAEIWSRLLRVEQVGIHDSFFDLGGDSLLVLQVVSDVRRVFAVEVPLSDFFIGPTVAQVARRVEEALLKRVRPDVETSRPTALLSIRHDPAKRFEPFPLTDIQHALLVGRGKAVELGNVGCHGYFEWEGVGIDLDAFRTAWQHLIDRHDMLRAIIRPDGFQRVLRDVPPYEIQVIDLREQDSVAAEEMLDELREEMSHKVFPVDHWPLFEICAALLSGDRTRLFVSFDLLIMDAWSYFQVVLPELVKFYENPDARLSPLEITFRDYVVAARAAVENSEAYQRSREYWMERLPHLPPAPSLPRAPVSKRSAPLRFNARGYSLEREEWSRLKARGQRAGVTSSVVLVAAFAEVLRTWSTNERFTINFPIYDRMPLNPQVSQLVGDFTNTLLVAVNKTDGTFEERARALQEQLWKDLEHRHFTGVQVIRELMRMYGGAVGASMPIVVTSLLGQPSPHQVTAFGREVHAISQTPQVLLDFQIREVEGVLRFNWDSLDAMFPPGMLDDMFNAYCNLLHRLALDEASWHKERFQLVPRAQLEQRKAINATDAPVPDVLLHELVAERARRQPDAEAVITSRKRLTFAEFHRRANQVGRRLRELDARPNELVAVVMEKGWEQYVGVYGILTSGAAYLPIDPAVPAERLRYLLENGETRTVLTQSWLVEHLPWPSSARILCVDRDFESIDSGRLEPAQKSTDLAYVIYTSGSTGKPKGVMVDHRGVVNMLLDINRRFEIGFSDRVFAISPLSFDASVYDVFGILAAGGGVVIPDPSTHPDPSHWAELIEREQVTFWNSVPALMDILVGHLEARTDLPLRSLRLTILSGDWIPLNLPRRLRTLGSHMQVMGSGGPTETIVWSIMYPIGEVDESWTSIPYGKPMTNQHYHILSPGLQHQPVWVPGEMYVDSRVGLAQGYWRDDELNKARFLTLPETGERIYATGDIGRYLPDGNIEILGRNDFQVKILGHRIELGEIEVTLREHADVTDAVVVAPKNDSDSRRLVAFVVLGSESPCTTEDLHRHLEEKLPSYVIPSSIVSLDQLPLSPNGKVDRNALTQLAVKSELTGSAEFVTPRSEIESVVAALCSEVLGVERIGVHDNFFTLGGNSLSAIRLAGRIRELLEVEVPLHAVFTHPTVAQVCQILTNEPEQRKRVLATAQVFAELSEEEMERMLPGVPRGFTWLIPS